MNQTAQQDLTADFELIGLDGWDHFGIRSWRIRITTKDQEIKPWR
jgi:hypothetical protein